MSTRPSPFADLAAPILDSDPSLADSQRTSLHDIFYDSKNPDELAQKLMPMADVPPDTKDKLHRAKQSMVPPPAPVAPLDKAISAIATLKSLPPEVADYAEAHPTLAKLLIGAATAPEKGAGEAPAGAGADSTTRKAGKTVAGKKGAAAAPVALPPRPDGLQHLPPIGENMIRVLSSDGGLHDVPRENVAKVFAIDPRAQILNP